MAWNKGSKVESTEMTIIKENNNNQNPIFSLISKFQSFFNLPPPPPPAKQQAAEEPKTGKVKVPRGQVEEFPSLRLEGDEQCRDQSTNPIVLWQVYAIGGFLVVRWMLARFKEKRTRKPPADEGSPPADD